MIDNEIISKLAEAIYLKGIREETHISPEVDWRRAERAFEFFEEAEGDPLWDEWHKEQYEWLYGLYLQLSKKENLKEGGY